MKYLLSVGALALGLSVPMQAQTRATNTLSLEDYLEWETVNSPRASPDGKQIIYGRRWADKMNDDWRTTLWIMNADGSRNRSLMDGTTVEWSPDGTRIAYTAKGEPGGSQVWVRWMDAEGATSQLTRLTESPGNLQWSPDGKWLAFTMTVPTKQTAWNIQLPSAPQGAKWTAPPRIVTTLDYKQDRVGFTTEGDSHIFVVSADGGTPRQVTSGAFDHGAPQWMPDGKTIVFTADRVVDPEYRWRQSDIYSVDVASGGITQLTRRNGPDQQPTPSPNGRMIAYTGYDSTRASYKDSELYVMNADGSNPRKINGDMDRSPQGLRWAPDGSGVYFNADNEGSRNLYFAPLNGPVKQITTGKHMLSVDEITRDGRAIGTLASATKPGDIVTFAVASPANVTQLTSVNDDVLTGKKMGEQEEIWYTSVGGLRIQGWIIKPPNFNPTRKYPLMLEIHGGPHAMYNVAFNFARQNHVAQDYVLLYTNPRGSTGYGSAFANEIMNAYPDKDFDDLMAGVDTVINRGYIDANRLYVFGCSGGGVLTAWIVGHTNRFAAASSNCPVINWLSFVGTTDGPGWYRNFAKPFWEDPSEHLKRSPIMYVGNVTTPTMLMTGVMDLRTPMPQTEEFYEALKFRKIPTAMLRFNDEWHGTSSKPSNFLRSQLYLRSWFERWPQSTPTQ